MKKNDFFYAVLACVVALVLGACSKDNEEPDSPAPNPDVFCVYDSYVQDITALSGTVHHDLDLHMWYIPVTANDGVEVRYYLLPGTKEADEQYRDKEVELTGKIYDFNQQWLDNLKPQPEPSTAKRYVFIPSDFEK